VFLICTLLPPAASPYHGPTAHPLFSSGHPTGCPGFLSLLLLPTLFSRHTLRVARVSFSFFVFILFSFLGTPYGLGGPLVIFSLFSLPGTPYGLAGSLIILLLSSFPFPFPWDTLRVGRASSYYFFSLFSSLLLGHPTGISRVGWDLSSLGTLAGLGGTPAGLTSFLSYHIFLLLLTLASLPLEHLDTGRWTWGNP
jgi:hypothetical protein